MRKLLLVFIIITVLPVCKKSDYQRPDWQTKPFVDVMVTATIQGRVVDENGKPAEDVSIRSGNNHTVTDVDGRFQFTNIQIGENAGSVTAEKTGYFKATRTMMVNAGAINYAEIRLIPREDWGSFPANSGGSIVAAKGSIVEISPNSIVTQGTNAAYNGKVHVISAYLLPDDPLLSSKMPGNLMALDANRYMKLLKTFGMIAVELEGPAGEKLSLANGKKAVVRFPIPTSMLSNAPATIPLWYFNDSTGLWAEQGVATKEGNIYVGSVSHFSFWNVDIPGDFVKLTMKLTDPSGNALPFYSVQLTDISDGSMTFGTTDSGGVVFGLVPINKTLKMEVDDFCTGQVYNEVIGPFSGDRDLGNIVLNVITPALVFINGSAANCTGGAVMSGYADIFLDGKYHRANIENGNYSSTIIRCSKDSGYVQISVTDLDDYKKSDPIETYVVSGSYTIEKIVACDTIPSPSEFINIEYLGFIPQVHINFTAPDDSLYALRSEQFTTIYGSKKDGSVVEIVFYNQRLLDTSYVSYSVSKCTIKTPALQLEKNPFGGIAYITSYGPRGGFISGSVSVLLDDNQGGNGNHSYLGFRVRRVQ